MGSIDPDHCPGLDGGIINTAVEAVVDLASPSNTPWQDGERRRGGCGLMPIKLGPIGLLILGG
jgi:hypothetical protein